MQSKCRLVHFEGSCPPHDLLLVGRKPSLSLAQPITYRELDASALVQWALVLKMLLPAVPRGRKPKAMTFTLSIHNFPKGRSDYRTGYLHRLS